MIYGLIDLHLRHAAQRRLSTSAGSGEAYSGITGPVGSSVPSAAFVHVRQAFFPSASGIVARNAPRTIISVERSGAPKCCMPTAAQPLAVDGHHRSVRTNASATFRHVVAIGDCRENNSPRHCGGLDASIFSDFAGTRRPTPSRRCPASVAVVTPCRGRGASATHTPSAMCSPRSGEARPGRVNLLRAPGRDLPPQAPSSSCAAQRPSVHSPAGCAPDDGGSR